MKYCINCGEPIDDSVQCCHACGASQPILQQPASQNENNLPFGCIGFCVPLAGLIMWLVWKDTKPARASTAGKWALISCIISFVLSGISGVLNAIFAVFH